MKCFTAFASLAMAGALALTGIAARGLSASAAEEASLTPGWYVVGNGNSAGYLGKCSWTEYLPAFHLIGESTGTSSKGYTDYLGDWTTDEVALYANDQFKFLYQSGKWEYPDQSGWGTDIVADLSDLVNQGDFIDGGLGNIQVAQGASAKYTFYLNVTEDKEGKVTIKITYDKGAPLEAPEKEYEMYLVGTIADIASFGWPGTTYPDPNDPTKELPCNWQMFPMTARWVIETEEGEDKGQLVLKYYTNIAITMTTTDQMKVYNAADNAYYPSGVEDNVSPTTNGKYFAEWKQDAPSFRFVTERPEAQPAPTPGN